MGDNTIIIIAATVISLIGAVGGIITARASASGAITEAAMKLITPLKGRIYELEKQNKQIKQIVLEWEKGIVILTEQLKSKGVIPKWEPKKNELDEAVKGE